MNEMISIAVTGMLTMILIIWLMYKIECTIYRDRFKKGDIIVGKDTESWHVQERMEIIESGINYYRAYDIDSNGKKTDRDLNKKIAHAFYKKLENL